MCFPFAIFSWFGDHMQTINVRSCAMQVLKAKLEEEASCGDIQRFTSTLQMLTATSPYWILCSVL